MCGHAISLIFSPRRFRLGICKRPSDLEYRDQFSRPGGDAGLGEHCFWVIFLCLRPYADSVPSYFVPLWDRLGILASAMVLRLGPASEWFVWPIPALISPFAGVFYPLSTLPQWMQYLSYLLPPSYVFEAMRGIISGGPVSQTALFWGGCLALLYILLACRFFVRTYRHALRTGIIARFSAETLS